MIGPGTDPPPDPRPNTEAMRGVPNCGDLGYLILAWTGVILVFIKALL